MQIFIMGFLLACWQSSSTKYINYWKSVTVAAAAAASGAVCIFPLDSLECNSSVFQMKFKSPLDQKKLINKKISKMIESRQYKYYYYQINFKLIKLPVFKWNLSIKLFMVSFPAQNI